MNRRVSLVIGVVLVLIGIVWTLQGLDILGGSGMSGVGIWAVIGPFVALIGVVVALGARRQTLTRFGMPVGRDRTRASRSLRPPWSMIRHGSGRLVATRR